MIQEALLMDVLWSNRPYQVAIDRFRLRHAKSGAATKPDRVVWQSRGCSFRVFTLASFMFDPVTLRAGVWCVWISANAAVTLR